MVNAGNHDAGNRVTEGRVGLYARQGEGYRAFISQ